MRTSRLKRSGSLNNAWLCSINLWAPHLQPPPGTLTATIHLIRAIRTVREVIRSRSIFLGICVFSFFACSLSVSLLSGTLFITICVFSALIQWTSHSDPPHFMQPRSVPSCSGRSLVRFSFWSSAWHDIPSPTMCNSSAESSLVIESSRSLPFQHTHSLTYMGTSFSFSLSTLLSTVAS